MWRRLASFAPSAGSTTTSSSLEARRTAVAPCQPACSGWAAPVTHRLLVELVRDRLDHGSHRHLGCVLVARRNRIDNLAVQLDCPFREMVGPGEQFFAD